MKRGELYRVHKPAQDPKKHRVYVIVSRHALVESRHSTVICAPIRTSGDGLATQVQVGIEHGLKHDSWIMTDNLYSIRKTELTSYVGMLPPDKLKELNQALRIALDL